MTNRQSTIFQLAAAVCLAMLFTVLTRVLFAGAAQLSNLYGGVSSFMTYMGAILFGYLFRPRSDTIPTISPRPTVAPAPAQPLSISDPGIILRVVVCVTITLFFGNGLLSEFVQHIRQLIAQRHLSVDTIGFKALQIDAGGLTATLVSLACLVYMFHVGFVARRRMLRPLLIGILVSDGLYAGLYLIFSLGGPMQMEQTAGGASLGLLPGVADVDRSVAVISAFIGLTMVSLVGEVGLLWLFTSLGSLSRRLHDRRCGRCFVQGWAVRGLGGR